MSCGRQGCAPAPRLCLRRCPRQRLRSACACACARACARARARANVCLYSASRSSASTVPAPLPAPLPVPAPSPAPALWSSGAGFPPLFPAGAWHPRTTARGSASHPPLPSPFPAPRPRLLRSVSLRLCLPREHEREQQDKQQALRFIAQPSPHRGHRSQKRQRREAEGARHEHMGKDSRRLRYWFTAPL